MALIDLLNSEPIEKIVEFPVKGKNGETAYYKLIELTENEKLSIRKKALEIAKKDVSGGDSIFDKELFADTYNRYYYAGLLCKCAIDADTNKPIFSSIGQILDSKLHTHCFSKMVEQYDEFIVETSPYVNGVADEKIEDIVKLMEGEFDANFLDDACKNFTHRDLKRLVFSLGCKLRKITSDRS